MILMLPSFREVTSAPATTPLHYAKSKLCHHKLDDADCSKEQKNASGGVRTRDPLLSPWVGSRYANHCTTDASTIAY